MSFENYAFRHDVCSATLSIFEKSFRLQAIICFTKISHQTAKQLFYCYQNNNTQPRHATKLWEIYFALHHIHIAWRQPRTYVLSKLFSKLKRKICFR